MKCRKIMVSRGIIVCATLLAGCAGDRVVGVRTVPTSEAQLSPLAGARACPFSLTEIVDKRGIEDLGQVIGARVDGKGFNHWLTNGIHAIPGHTAGAAPVSLKIEILKAHIHAISTHKSANVILRVQATDQSNTQTTKIYRGVDGSMNWSGSESEIQNAFDRALADLQQQISNDLSRLCKQ